MQPNNSLDNKLPKELREEYKNSCKNSPAIEGLKVAAALKLWNDRGFRDIKFDASMPYNRKKFFVNVLARNAEGSVVGVECAAAVSLGRLRKKIAALRSCLPPDSYIIAVFPSTVGDEAKKVTAFVDEVWVTGKDGTVEQMLFRSVFHKEK